MNWTKLSPIQDNYVWKCQFKECNKFKSKVSIRKDSFFAKFKLPLRKWIQAIYYWCENISETTVTNILNNSEKTMIDIYSFLREICMKHFKANPIRLGGSGIIVQIDKSCFARKNKDITEDVHLIGQYGYLQWSTRALSHVLDIWRSLKHMMLQLYFQ